MKIARPLRLRLLATLFAAVIAPGLAHAQTTTTTTTTVVPASPAPVQIQGQVQVQPVQPVQPAPVVVAPQPGQHVVEIDLSVDRGSVQAYFGRAPRGETAEIGGLKLNVKLPSTATVTKLASRDKDSEGATKILSDNPWHAVVNFNGGGRYVFNMVEWDNDPVVTSLVIKVDGAVMFSGHGRADDIENWPVATFGPGARKTGSREIAFVLAD